LDETSGRDFLFIGTAQSVQAYDVQRNAEVFYIDVPEGVNCMTIGACNKSLAPLLYVGSNLSIVGVDVTGKEQMWTVTGSEVVVLSAVASAFDSRQELAAGTKACDILVFKAVLLPVS
jgi:Bardet-Biedl syndrome 2 protein